MTAPIPQGTPRPDGAADYDLSALCRPFLAAALNLGPDWRAATAVELRQSAETITAAGLDHVAAFPAALADLLDGLDQLDAVEAFRRALADLPAIGDDPEVTR